MKKGKEIIKLPERWIWTTIGEIGLLSSGGTPSRGNASYFRGDIPWVKSGELNYNIIHDTEEKISQEALENSSAKIIPANSLLIALYGSTVGKLATLGIDASTNQAVAAIITFSKFNQRFLYYYLFHNREKLLLKRKGGAQPNISQKILFDFPFPLPPFVEQNNIITKIDQVFSELDQVNKGLQKARQQLRIYKQALLKNAFEGKLSEKWHLENNPESAKRLLIDIKKEKEKYYKQQLENWKGEVKSWEEEGKESKRPKKPNSIYNVSNLSPGEVDKLPLIPDKWKWVKFGEVCLKIMDGTHFSPKNYGKGKYKYITSKNILEGRIDLSDITYVSEEDHNVIYGRCDVTKGDILYVKDGAKTGRAAVNKLEEEFSLLSSVGVFRTIKDKIDPKFLEYFLNAEVNRKRMLSKVSGVAITRLTLTKLNNSLFTLCSIKEQKHIVEILESRFTLIENLEKSIEKSLSNIILFKQSLLKKAFEGRLVNQDSNDESTNELLQEIKGEKEEYIKKQKELDKLRPKKKRKMEAEKTILEILKENNEPILAKELWQKSIHKNNIEEFYFELKDIYHQLDEIKKDTKSLLSLKK